MSLNSHPRRLELLERVERFEQFKPMFSSAHELRRDMFSRRCGLSGDCRAAGGNFDSGGFGLIDDRFWPGPGSAKTEESPWAG